MELKVSDKTEQPLLSRTELSGVISFDSATPSRLDVRKKFAEALKTDESLIAVTKVATSFGSKSAKVTAHIYKSKDDIARFESKKVLNRHLEKKEKAVENKAEGKAPEDKTKKKTAATAADSKEQEQKKAETAAADKKPAEGKKGGSGEKQETKS